MRKKTLILTLLILTLALFISNFPTVQAQTFSYQEFDLSGSPILATQKAQGIEMGNGRYVYVFASSSHSPENLTLIVLSSAGSLLATSDITPDNDNATWDYSFYPLNDDDLLIMCVLLKSGGTVNRQPIACAIEYDTIAFTHNVYKTAYLGDTITTDGNATISQIFPYDSKYYGLISGTVSPVTTTLYWEYDPSINNLTTVSNTIADVNASLGAIWGFFDTRAGEEDMVYLISAQKDDFTKPRFWKWDLTTWETDPELLADSGTTSWYHDNDISMRYISGDLEYNSTTAMYILYHNWALSEDDGTDDHIYIFQHRLEFNNTVIDTDYLENQELLQDSISLNTGHATSESSVISGFETSHTAFSVYAQNKYGDPSDYQSYHLPVTISNFWTIGSASLDITGLGEWDLEIPCWSAPLYINYKSSEETFATVIKDDKTSVRIYYGLEAQQEGWSVTWTHTPAHDPLLINTNYGFSGTVELNDIGFQSSYIVYFDDVVKYTRETQTNGGFGFTLITNVQGLHTLNISVYYNGEYKTSDEENLIFTDTGEDAGTQGGAVMINAIMDLLPTFTVVLIPPLIMTPMMGQMGFIAGLVIGGVVGTASGILPTYGLYLIILVIVMAFVYYSRK